VADSYAALLDALGFNGSDAAHQIGQTQRRLEATQSQIRLGGEDERESLQASAESRGVLSSGEYSKNTARQRADEASRMSLAETDAADRVSAINRELQRAKAQRQLQDEQYSTDRRIADERWALEKSLLNTQVQTAQQGFDWQALYQALGLWG
jgi:hypothetical protein